jgi:cysteinyl-tRNA synthetase
LKSNIPSPDKLDLLYEFDQVFGLKLSEVEEQTIPQDIIDIANQRQQSKLEKNFQKSDELRKLISEKGYEIRDVAGGYELKKSSS